jgi:hypothetical protein
MSVGVLSASRKRNAANPPRVQARVVSVGNQKTQEINAMAP